MIARYFSAGGPNAVLSDEQLRSALDAVLAGLGPRRRVLAIPPDFTRFDSRAGLLTRYLYDHYGAALVHVLPALGTHVAMSPAEIARMFPGVPSDRFRVHAFRRDVARAGTLEPLVKEVTEATWDRAWHAELNRLVADGGHDLIVSIGQVVPHEVAGMAGHAKNLFIGTGGPQAINDSHFIGAVYGMERMMGRIDTPVRRLLNEALNRFCQHLPILFVLTVVGPARAGEPADERGLVTRGLFIGTGTDCFDACARLSQEVNVTLVDRPLAKVVVYMDPEEFRSTWLANKAVYRTRMAIADGGELVVLAPGVSRFGEDASIDALIRKYGYRPSQDILNLVRKNPDLEDNLSAAAHLIHGSPEGRFRVTYCAGGLPRDQIEAVGYAYGNLAEMLKRYDPGRLTDGFNDVDGEILYFVSKPALGLWAHRDRIREART